MSCQQNLDLLENGALDVKSSTGACVGCQDLLKELAVKDKIILELQQKLDGKHKMSENSDSNSSKEDLSQKFQITSFDLGVELPVVRAPKSLSSAKWPHSTDSDSLSGFPDGSTTAGQHVVNRKHTTTIHTESSTLLQLFQQRQEFPQGGDHLEVKRMVTLQQIIDKVIETTPKHGKRRLFQQNNGDDEDRTITVQEIINNIVEKNGNEFSYKRKSENVCNKRQEDAGTWCKLFAAYETGSS